MVCSFASPELVIRLVSGKLMRDRYKYYPRLEDEESGQF
jgi:hypothetical protein